MTKLFDPIVNLEPMKLANLVFQGSFSLILALCISCQPNASSDGNEEIQLVDNFLTAFFSKDVDAAQQLVMEGSIIYGPALADSTTVEDWADSWRAAFDSPVTNISYERTANKFMEVTVGENPVLAGNWVLEWGQVSIEYSDQTSSTVWWHAVFRCEEGKIVVSRIFYDNEDLFSQRGYSMEPPKPVDSSSDSLSTDQSP